MSAPQRGKWEPRYAGFVVVGARLECRRQLLAPPSYVAQLLSPEWLPVQKQTQAARLQTHWEPVAPQCHCPAEHLPLRAEHPLALCPTSEILRSKLAPYISTQPVTALVNLFYTKVQGDASRPGFGIFSGSKMPTVALARLLRADPGGLSSAEARTRQATYGPNIIAQTYRPGWRALLTETAKDPMIWFLVLTAMLYFAIGERLEGATLLVALAPLVAMDGFLHWRTQASTAALGQRLAKTAEVLRNGLRVELLASELVPGDIVLLHSGGTVPADGAIVTAAGLQLDESALTGEAYPVPKIARPWAHLAAEVSVPEESWVSAGTRVLTGNGLLRVGYTGGDTTYAGIIALASGRAERTPLQQSISSLVSGLLAAAAVLCLTLAFVRLRQGYGLLDAVVSAATLAVAALPEEFPVVFTVFLGVGAYRLARRQALVRRAVSVENIGRVTVICSDKTGTITEGRLRVHEVVPASGTTSDEVLTMAALAARSDSGDPIDDALFAIVPKAKIADFGSRIRVHPYTEDRRCEVALWRHHKSTVAATKGAPESVLPMTTLSASELARWHEAVAALAHAGLKVLAVALRQEAPVEATAAPPERGFALMGLIGFADPVRPGVDRAVHECRHAGIRVIMLTGDHPATAQAVARAVGLGNGEPRVVQATGGDPNWAAKAVDADVVARAHPAQKLALVRALQARGERVVVTGDGVNDVPALQAADVGVAFGGRGTESARENAAIVLLDDNFATLVGAIREGRQLFRNLQMSFVYLLVIHVPLVITATVIPLAGYPLLYLPVHIVWLELIIHPTAMLVFQATPPQGPLAPVGRSTRRGFFATGDWLFVILTGAAVTLSIIATYDRALATSTGHARAMAILVLVACSASLVVVLTRLATPVARVVATVTLAVSLLLVEVPFLASPLHLVPLHVDDLALSLIIATVCVLAPGWLWTRRRQRDEALHSG